jgi:hypothetical protein
MTKYYNSRKMTGTRPKSVSTTKKSSYGDFFVPGVVQKQGGYPIADCGFWISDLKFWKGRPAR